MGIGDRKKSECSDRYLRQQEDELVHKLIDTSKMLSLFDYVSLNLPSHMTLFSSLVNCPRPNGQFQDSSDCSKYYNCVNNVFTNRACPAGQLFDNTVGQCRNTNTWPSGCNMPASWGIGGGGAGCKYSLV